MIAELVGGPFGDQQAYVYHALQLPLEGPERGIFKEYAAPFVGLEVVVVVSFDPTLEEASLRQGGQARQQSLLEIVVVVDVFMEHASDVCHGRLHHKVWQRFSVV